MGSVPIVSVHPGYEGASSVSGGVVASTVGPLFLEGADKPFGLSVGLGSVGLRVQVSDLELIAESVEAFRDVAGAVVGHDALDVYAVGGEEGHGSLKEVGTRVLVFCG